jgi:hypothetical protein
MVKLALSIDGTYGSDGEVPDIKRRGEVPVHY